VTATALAAAAHSEYAAEVMSDDGLIPDAIDPEGLWQCVQAAVQVAGLPQWSSPEPDGEAETLVFLSGDEAAWVLAPLSAMTDDEDGACAFHPEHDEDGDDHNGHCGCDGPDLVAVGADLAADLIKSHLRGWLAARGWQVQMTLLKGSRTWRLADCLSFAEGGGDRLDQDYPHGDDELAVLCASVLSLGVAAG
jgi:hypothetical protein